MGGQQRKRVVPVRHIRGRARPVARLQQRLAASRLRQNQYLAQIAIDELAQQKERLDAYQVQARFALAAIYDRAATAPAVKPGEEPADGAAPAPDAPATGSPPAGGGAR